MAPKSFRRRIFIFRVHPLAADPAADHSPSPPTSTLGRDVALHFPHHRSGSLLAYPRNPHCAPGGPSGARRLPLHRRLCLSPYCARCPFPLPIPSDPRLTSGLPHTPTDRQTAVWPSGCPATRRCLPASMREGASIQPASGGFESRRVSYKYRETLPLLRNDF